MRPRPSRARFSDWYNNEHGPDHLRMSTIFTNGLRYRSCDDEPALFMALYDVPHMDRLSEPAYTSLRARRSPREAETMAAHVQDVRRCLFDLVWAAQSPSFTPIEDLADHQAHELVTVAEQVALSRDAAASDDYRDWFVDERVSALASSPAWLRSRLFKPSNLERPQDETVAYLALHDYARCADDTLPADAARRSSLLPRSVTAEHRRTWSLLYVFGPAPRDLEAVSLNTPGLEPVISSYVTAEDSLTIPYLLEGNPSPGAPVVAFSNSLLTSLDMWDPLLAVLKKARPDLRILRYDTRGRHSIPHPPRAATLGRLTADLVQLLDSLRIAQLHALVGVSIGGATTLSLAINNPTRLRKFVACDFNCASTPANTQAWKDRVSVARDSSGRGIQRLADQTVARWLHPVSLEKTHLRQWLTDMAAANDVEGFEYSCTALWDYDLRPHMEGCAVQGLFVVGEADAKGAVAKAMDCFKHMLGNHGAELKVVPNTGHLPMCEDPLAFWELISQFL